MVIPAFVKEYSSPSSGGRARKSAREEKGPGKGAPRRRVLFLKGRRKKRGGGAPHLPRRRRRRRRRRRAPQHPSLRVRLRVASVHARERGERPQPLGGGLWPRRVAFAPTLSARLGTRRGRPTRRRLATAVSGASAHARDEVAVERSRVREEEHPEEHPRGVVEHRQGRGRRDRRGGGGGGFRGRGFGRRGALAGHGGSSRTPRRLGRRGTKTRIGRRRPRLLLAPPRPPRGRRRARGRRGRR